ncbi:MAG: hypothetical protein WEE89_19220 [Gemmatimonadota bacterium]
MDTIIKNSGAPRYRGVAALVPELRIGRVDGPPEYLFGGPSEILGLSDGSVVVIDWAGSIGAPTTALAETPDGGIIVMRSVVSIT